MAEGPAARAAGPLAAPLRGGEPRGASAYSRAMRPVHAGFAFLVACGSTVEPARSPEETVAAEPVAAEPVAAEPVAAPPVTPVTTEPSGGPAAPAAEAEARALAEAFVRAQGYADTPPSVTGDAIVHEGIEGTLEDRLDTLDPHAVEVAREGEGWRAVFRYRDPRYAGRGRVLRLPAGGTPRFVHQDFLLSALAPE